MNTLIIVSKPSDVLHSDDLVYGKLLNTNRHYLIVGEGRKQNQTAELLKSRGVTFKATSSFDYYYNNFHAFGHNLGKRLYFAAVNYFFWHKSLAFRLTGDWDNVVLDFWRNKACLLIGIKPTNIFIIDGGISTVTWNLVVNWERLGSEVALMRYLRSQKFNKPRDKSEKYPLSAFLGMLTGGTPFLVRRAISKKLSEAKSIFLFTAYSESSTKFAIEKNLFKHGPHREVIVTRQREALIIGYPNGQLIKKQWQLINKIQKENGFVFERIFYRWHPSTFLGEEEKLRLLTAVHPKIITYESKLSLEFDIISAGEVPEFIFGYQSSALKWLSSLRLNLKIYRVQDFE